MNHAEFCLFLQALSQIRLVQASDTIEDAVELQVHDTLVCVEWNGEQQRLELTVPLPELLDEQDPDSLRLRLYRALFAWQWSAAAHGDCARFGALGASGPIVGMASIPAEGIGNAQALDAAVQRAHEALQQAWQELGAQVLAEELGALSATTDTAPAQRATLLQRI